MIKRGERQIMKTYRIEEYKDARKFFDSYMKSKRDYAIIHYACQGFYSCDTGKSPRIAAICIFYPSSGQQHLFSLVSLAELRDIDLTNASNSTFDELEKELLKQFYDFVKKQKRDVIWLHWNMKDHCYGFQALSKRYCKLWKKSKPPVDFAQDKKENIATLLRKRFGEHYSVHPRLQNLLELNNIHPKNLLTGAEEAARYDQKDFLAIERSLEDKVAAFAEVLDRIGNGELKTRSQMLKDIYGISFLGIFTYVKENAFLAAIFSIIGGVIINIITNLITGN